jgi:hypothetical protein
MSSLIPEVKVGDRLLLVYKIPSIKPSVVIVTKLTFNIIYTDGGQFSKKDGMKIPWDRSSFSQDYVIRVSENRIAEILEEWDNESKSAKLVSKLKSFDWSRLNSTDWYDLSLSQLEEMTSFLTKYIKEE